MPNTNFRYFWVLSGILHKFLALAINQTRTRSEAAGNDRTTIGKLEDTEDRKKEPQKPQDMRHRRHESSNRRQK